MIKEDVNELATWTGQGIAYYSGSKRRDVGSVFCRAASTTGLLAFLNNMVGVFEYEVDENGNSGGKIWSGNNTKIVSHRYLFTFTNFS